MKSDAEFESKAVEQMERYNLDADNSSRGIIRSIQSL